MTRPSATAMTVPADLGTHPCFAGVHRRVLRDLERHGNCVAVTPATAIQPRQEPRWVYFVLSGAIAADDGRDTWLVGAGGVVGLGVAFGNAAEPLAVEAAATSLVYVTSTHDLRRIASTDPILCERLATYLAHHSSAI